MEKPSPTVDGYLVAGVVGANAGALSAGNGHRSIVYVRGDNQHMVGLFDGLYDA